MSFCVRMCSCSKKQGTMRDPRQSTTSCARAKLHRDLFKACLPRRPETRRPAKRRKMNATSVGENSGRCTSSRAILPFCGRVAI